MPWYGLVFARVHFGYLKGYEMTLFSAKPLRSHTAKLILAMAVVLVLIYVAQPYISGFTGTEKTSSKAQPQEASATPTSTLPNEPTSVQSLPAGSDPFKAHLEKKASSGPTAAPSQALAPNANAPLPSGNPANSGTDPFKTFLEQQKKQSKDAGVSPFGK